MIEIAALHDGARVSSTPTTTLNAWCVREKYPFRGQSADKLDTYASDGDNFVPLYRAVQILKVWSRKLHLHTITWDRSYVFREGLSAREPLLQENWTRISNHLFSYSFIIVFPRAHKPSTSRFAHFQLFERCTATVCLGSKKL